MVYQRTVRRSECNIVTVHLCARNFQPTRTLYKIRYARLPSTNAKNSIRSKRLTFCRLHCEYIILTPKNAWCRHCKQDDATGNTKDWGSVKNRNRGTVAYFGVKIKAVRGGLSTDAKEFRMQFCDRPFVCKELLAHLDAIQITLWKITVYIYQLLYTIKAVDVLQTALRIHYPDPHECLVSIL